MACPKTFVPLCVRPAFEAASSMARALNDPLAEATGLHRVAAMRNLAFGTASCPLHPLAEMYGGLMGSGEQLRDLHTLFRYCAIGLATRQVDAFSHRLLDGQGAISQWHLPAWLTVGTVARKLCVVCCAEAWRNYGVEADFYPHYVPGVRGCWRHGTRLVLATEIDGALLNRRPQVATAHELAFAQTSFAVAQLDPHEARDVLRRRTAQAGYYRSDGRYYAKQFQADFNAFCAQVGLPCPLLRLATQPRRLAALCGWMGDEERRLHPLYIVLLDWFLSSTLAADRFPAAPRGARSQTRAGWGAKRPNGPGPCPVDRRRHYTRDEIPALLAQGCTCLEIAGLCLTSQATVHRIVRERGYRAQCNHGFAERLRRRARAAWLAVQRRYPWMSANQLQHYEPNAWSWLQHHDPVWLSAHRPVAWPTDRGRRVDPGPKGRACAVAARLRQALKQMQTEVQAGRRVRFSRRAICRQMGIDEYALVKAERWDIVRDMLKAVGCVERRHRKADALGSGDEQAPAGKHAGHSA